MTPLERVLALLPASPTPARPFVLGIDGRSGSGKTNLAAAVAGHVTGAQVLALEDAYRGWGGLREGVEEIASGVLAELRAGRTGAYRRYDWARGELGGTVPVGPSAVVVLEGCGAGSLPCAPYVDALVWLEAPEHERHHRAMARDDGAWLDQWSTWAAQESALLAERDARAAADLVLETSTE
ncbi:para-aminobenzoate synthetase [Georgenia satyanarayanai]|uniref:Para-aminobenzoate synthetase n=1 Tax=Georgenia satyanarayanai TaxID=860221 RepID=A0A2Y9A4S9_9MICO|nr:4-amino-4-deoxy-L-arabinose transferase [Georgenia satyanarayanai]PYG02343.1 para-aminobenzoate synthetase [Georgenia satyanarayanai]SSA37217.1 para-aminobenzoate synthetase [Georgenia satyanarayanai]